MIGESTINAATASEITPRDHDDHQSGRAIRIALRREMPEAKQTLPDPTYRLATPSQRRRWPLGTRHAACGRVGTRLDVQLESLDNDDSVTR